VRVTVCSMHFFHSGHSKAKNGSVLPLVTGGNWKKSPVMTNCGAYTSSPHHRSGDDYYVPVCRQMAVRCSSGGSGKLTRGCRKDVRPPWRLGPIYSYIVPVGSGIEMLTLVNDQYLCCLPPIKRGFTLSYALYLFIEIRLTWRDRSPRVDSHPYKT